MKPMAVKERPILFSAPMVRAILDGRKTMTRRAVKDQSQFPGNRRTWPIDASSLNSRDGLQCPYGKPGERLWVRETFAHAIDAGSTALVTYKATPRIGRAVMCDDEGEGDRVGTKAHDDVPACTGPWKPSIHMPRWASRITLEITGVRVERLCSITHSDIIAEGIEVGPAYPGETPKESLRRRFEGLWRKINSPDSWDANPWVWVIGFEVAK